MPSAKSSSSSPPRLLLAGVGPLPPELPERLFAPGLRVWGMARELARAGHAIRLVCGRFGEAAAQAAEAAIFDLPASQPESAADATVALPSPRCERAAEGWPVLLAREAREFGAAAAIGTTDVMNHALARSGLDFPIWMDYFGDPMAERQMLAVAQANDEGLSAQWEMLAPALARADRISCCARAHVAALHGQLAAVGRMGRLTAFEDLVELLPPWIEPLETMLEGGGDDPREPLVRGKLAPADALLVVQTGGFNTWLDVATLFGALERAMDESPRVHFACTGGAIAGHHMRGFEDFERQVRASRHAARFHPLDWRTLAEVRALLAEADLAVNLDLPCLEGRNGTRNRIFDWLLAGLPVISTPGCDLACDLGDAGFLTLIPHGDALAAARAIVSLLGAAQAARASAQRGAAWLREAHAPAHCLRPLLNWALAPQSASDLQAWREGRAAPPSLWMAARGGSAARRLAWSERRLARLEGSRLVRWALRLRGGRDRDEDPPPPEP